MGEESGEGSQECFVSRGSALALKFSRSPCTLFAFLNRYKKRKAEEEPEREAKSKAKAAARPVNDDESVFD
jgi:hypothetical protein